MTDERRKKVFPGRFDLGSKNVVPSNSRTYGKLASEISQETKMQINAGDMLKTLRKGIKEITGRELGEHLAHDTSTTLKVVKTLVSILRGSKWKLMHLLKDPDGGAKFSMSFRGQHPYEKNEEQVYLIADLKEYLGAELSNDRYNEIRSVFACLEEKMAEIIADTDRAIVLRDHGNYAAALESFKQAVAMIEGFGVNPDALRGALDEELFVYLHALEFSHFAAGYSRMIKESIPQTKVVPVFADIRKLIREVLAPLDLDPRMNEGDEIFPISFVAEFCELWKLEIVRILETAMARTMLEDQYEKISACVENLLRNLYWSRISQETTLDDQKTLVSPIHIFGALCSSWLMLESHPNFKAYWPGQVSQGGSIVASIKDLFNSTSIDPVPEEHRHILANGVEWFADALRGQTELRESRFALKSALVLKINNICRKNNPSRIPAEIASLARAVRTFVRPTTMN